MNRRRCLQGAGAATLGAWFGNAAAGAEQDDLVGRATTSLSHFFRDPDMRWFQDRVPVARAILIAPEIVKAGFIVGGSGGRAVLIARDRIGKWAGPAFYALATGSIGFQAGLQVAEAVTLVRTDKGFESLSSTSMKFGADASIATGPVGKGATQDMVTDLVSFSRAKGLYGGINLDGTVVSLSADWNAAYYGKPASASDILIRRRMVNPKSSRLLRMAAFGPGPGRRNR